MFVAKAVAMLVLKRLTDATRDGDRVLAVIRGSAANQDGRTFRNHRPQQLSDSPASKRPWRLLDWNRRRNRLHRAHGTGTPLGDPIEIQSLAKILKRVKASEPPCYVASVKGNIGHTETVSGVAGLIKVILMMQREMIPAQTGLETLNENIQLVGSASSFLANTRPGRAMAADRRREFVRLWRNEYACDRGSGFVPDKRSGERDGASEAPPGHLGEIEAGPHADRAELRSRPRPDS